MPIIQEGCPVIGHWGGVERVQFSDDGAQVISGSDNSYDNTVRVWNVRNARQVRQLTSDEFAFVEGPSNEHTWNRYFLTCLGRTLLIYEGAKGQPHAEDGAAAAPVACFNAPGPITSVRCHGAAICVGCCGGEVCFLSAPFLAV